MSSILSVALTGLLVLSVGALVRALLRKLHVPPALSLMALGVVLGSSWLDLLGTPYLDIAPELSRAAFTVLLLRAGLAVDFRGARRLAVPILLLTAVVFLEIGAVASLGRALVLWRWDLAFLLGFLIAAVSPAVVLPEALQLREHREGAARVADLVIGQTMANVLIAQIGILFLIESIAPTRDGLPPVAHLALQPVRIVAGIVLGVCAAAVFARVVSWRRTKATTEVRRGALGLFVLSGGWLVYFVAHALKVEPVIAALAFGMTLRTPLLPERDAVIATLRGAWGWAEILLFVNLGAIIEIERLSDIPLLLSLLVVIAGAVSLRLVAVAVLSGSLKLRRGERGYLVAANLPKATIQAVHGATPLVAFQAVRSEFVPAGQTLLIAAVFAIALTAPLGAILLARGRRWV